MKMSGRESKSDRVGTKGAVGERISCTFKAPSAASAAAATARVLKRSRLIDALLHDSSHCLDWEAKQRDTVRYSTV